MLAGKGGQINIQGEQKKNDIMRKNRDNRGGRGCSTTGGQDERV